MTSITATKFQEHLFEYLNQAVSFNDVINIVTQNGNAIILNEDDYNGLLETLRIMSMPGMVERIKESENEPLEECTVYVPGEEW